MIFKKQSKLITSKKNEWFVNNIFVPIQICDTNKNFNLPNYYELRDSGVFEEFDETPNLNKSDKVICQNSFVIRSENTNEYYASERNSVCYKTESSRITKGRSCLFTVSGGAEPKSLIFSWFEHALIKSESKFKVKIIPKGIAINQKETKVNGHEFRQSP